MLHRSLLGATQALQSLSIEEHRRQVKLAQRFRGNAYRLGDGKRVKQVPATTPVSRGIPSQGYPGVDGIQHVVIPFLLLGSFNLKTGVIRLEKVHIHHVYNHITYRGHVRVVGLDENDHPVELRLDALARQLESACSELPPSHVQKVHQLHLDLTADWSHASLLMSADMTDMSLLQPQSLCGL